MTELDTLKKIGDWVISVEASGVSFDFTMDQEQSGRVMGGYPFLVLMFFKGKRRGLIDTTKDQDLHDYGLRINVDNTLKWNGQRWLGLSLPNIRMNRITIGDSGIANGDTRHVVVVIGVNFWRDISIRMIRIPTKMRHRRDRQMMYLDWWKWLENRKEECQKGKADQIKQRQPKKKSLR